MTMPEWYMNDATSTKVQVADAETLRAWVLELRVLLWDEYEQRRRAERAAMLEAGQTDPPVSWHRDGHEYRMWEVAPRQNKRATIRRGRMWDWQVTHGRQILWSGSCALLRDAMEAAEKAYRQEEANNAP